MNPNHQQPRPSRQGQGRGYRSTRNLKAIIYLIAVPAVTCKECGIKQVSVPWARSDSGFTLLFEALVRAMARAMPVAVVARMVDEWDTRL
jgi:transposase